MKTKTSIPKIRNVRAKDGSNITFLPTFNPDDFIQPRSRNCFHAFGDYLEDTMQRGDPVPVGFASIVVYQDGHYRIDTNMHTPNNTTSVTPSLTPDFIRTIFLRKLVENDTNEIIDDRFMFT
jgi:hypothetical protein